MTAFADHRPAAGGGLARTILARPITRFLAIGVLSTAAYAVLVLLLIGSFGSSGANLLALAITAVANTAANRRLTFGVRGRAHAARQYAASLVVFLMALAITDGALALLGHYDRHPSRPTDLVVLVAATLVATVCRFAALRAFVFRRVQRLPVVESKTTAGEVGSGLLDDDRHGVAPDDDRPDPLDDPDDVGLPRLCIRRSGA